MENNSQITKKPRTLNIIYIANFHVTSVGEPEIARALERLGHKVDCFQDDQYTPLELKEKIAAGNYDFLLFAKLKIGNDMEIMKFIRDCPIPTVCWVFDLYWGYRLWARIKDKPSPVFVADIVFTTDGGHLEEWENSEVNHFCLRQGAEVDEMYFGKPDPDQTAEILFLGTKVNWHGWQYRPMMIDKLTHRYGRRFLHTGKRGNIRHKELNDLIASAKIVIGDSVFSENYWSNRIYEMIGKGAFLISPDVPGLEKEFTYYKHFIPYTIRDFDGLFAKIDYFLEKPEERRKIQEAGLEHMKKNHTYDHRVVDLLKVLKEQKII